MRKLIIVLVGLFVLTLPAFADTAGCPGTSGGELPAPFFNANLRVELAHGEYYILKGTIKNIVGKPYFKVDFKEQAWLKNNDRQSFPYYRIERTGLIDWTKYEGQYVEIYTRAERQVVLRNGNYFNSEIWLTVWIDPTVISPAPASEE
jgi:hypothetical protein